jgi:putative acetyltransferase
LATTLRIDAETPADRDAVRDVVRRAFGREDEASLVEALRTDRYVRTALVAKIDQLFVGHVLFSELAIVTVSATIPALALAPVAVLPEFQRQGIGSQLIRRGLDDCRQQGHRIVVVLGHPGFYPRFGFSSELARRLESPFTGRPSFMAMELVESALDGVTGRVRYAPPFGIA